MKARVTMAVLGLLAACPVWAQQAQQYDDRPKISVTGEATVNIKPDKIIIRLGIETDDKDISTAKQKNNEILKKAVAVIRECGVPEKDIQTDHLSLEPRWRSEYPRRDFLGYFVRNGIAVTVGDAEKLDDMVTRLLQSGVDHIHGIDFQTVKLKECREQARELALKAAKEKAEKMAAVLGQSVGAPIQISENANYGWYSYWSSWSWWGGGRSSAMSQVQVDRGDPGQVTDTLALGKLAIRASVNVTFELKPQQPPAPRPK
jgi:uncharacterized protein